MMKKITIENNRESAYEAVLFSAKKHGTCQSSLLEGRFLIANQPVAIHDVGLVTPIQEGSPKTSSGYNAPPMYFKKVAIEGPDEKAITDWIKQAEKEYEKEQMNFQRDDDQLLVLTWDGGCWSDEYNTSVRKTMYLPGQTYQKILGDLTLFYESKDDYTRLDVPWARTYMLHGLPGTGKTTLVYTLASQLGKDIAIIDFSSRDICDETIRRAVFKLPPNTLLVLEDIDSLFKERKSENTGVTFSGLLNVLDGIVKNSGLVIFMTTNFIENIDDAALKRRVDYYLKFDVMTPDQIETMFSRFYPEQDAKKFVNRVKDLSLTPCILQKFFVRRLRSMDVLADIKELEDMCSHEYKVISDKNSMYM